MINNTSLTGRLTKDADLRYTNSGKAVASFTLAVDRQFKRDNEPTADFINCVIWNKPAEALQKYTRKGSLIGVTGRIQTRSYDGKDGQRVYVTEVVVNSIAFLESKNSNGNNGATQQPNNSRSQSHAAPQQTPQSGQQAANTSLFAGQGKTIDIDDDDLPF